jgi:hypothetical protein
MISILLNILLSLCSFCLRAFAQEEKALFVNWLRPPIFPMTLPYQADGSPDKPFTSLITAFNEVKKRWPLAPGETTTVYIYVSQGPHLIKTSDTAAYFPYYAALSDWDGKSPKHI